MLLESMAHNLSTEQLGATEGQSSYEPVDELKAANLDINRVCQALKGGMLSAVQDLLDPLSETQWKMFLKQHRYMALDCAENGHWEIVQYLIQKGIDLNARHYRSGKTLLICAAGAGMLSIVKLLVSKNADVNVRDRRGSTALLDAVEKGDQAIFELLVDNEADVRAEDRFGNTAIILAAFGGDLSVVMCLFENTPQDVDTKNDIGRTALMYAAYGGHLQVVKYLIEEKKANVHLVDEDGSPAILHAAEGGDLPTMKYLIEKGDLHVKDTYGKTALMNAARENRLSIVKFLIEESGVELNDKDKDGNTALMFAAERGHWTIFDYLVEKADVRVKNASRRSVLMVAAEQENADRVKYLIEKRDAIVDDQDQHGRTPLMFAALGGHLPVVQFLVEEARADLDVQDNKGKTALLYPPNKDSFCPIVRYLIERGADTGVRDGDQKTVLMYAAEKGDLPATKYLLSLEQEVDVDARDWRDRTAIMFAVLGGHLSVVKCLRVTQKAESDSICLLLAILERHWPVAHYLIEEGVDVECQDDEGQTALMLAAQAGSLDTVCMLVERGAGVQRKCEREYTSWMYALQNGHHHVVSYLLSFEYQLSQEQAWSEACSVLGITEEASASNQPSTSSVASDLHRPVDLSRLPMGLLTSENHKRIADQLKESDFWRKASITVNAEGVRDLPVWLGSFGDVTIPSDSKRWLHSPPSPTIARGAAAVASYLRAKQAGEVPVEALFCATAGRPASGKTSVWKSLQVGKPKPQPEEGRTVGVSVIPDAFRLNEPDDEGTGWTVNLRDFPGQGAYYPSHGMLINSAALILHTFDLSKLVVCGQDHFMRVHRCEAANDLEWLNRVHYYAAGAGVVLIGTRIDMTPIYQVPVQYRPIEQSSWDSGTCTLFVDRIEIQEGPISDQELQLDQLSFAGEKVHWRAVDVEWEMNASKELCQLAKFEEKRLKAVNKMLEYFEDLAQERCERLRIASRDGKGIKLLGIRGLALVEGWNDPNSSESQALYGGGSGLRSLRTLLRAQVKMHQSILFRVGTHVPLSYALMSLFFRKDKDLQSILNRALPNSWSKLEWIQRQSWGFSAQVSVQSVVETALKHEICTDVQQVRDALGFLHDSGVILYFTELPDCVFSSPELVMEALKRIVALSMESAEINSDYNSLIAYLKSTSASGQLPEKMSEQFVHDVFSYPPEGVSDVNLKPLSRSKEDTLAILRLLSTFDLVYCDEDDVSKYLVPSCLKAGCRYQEPTWSSANDLGLPSDGKSVAYCVAFVFNIVAVGDESSPVRATAVVPDGMPAMLAEHVWFRLQARRRRKGDRLVEHRILIPNLAVAFRPTFDRIHVFWLRGNENQDLATACAKELIETTRDIVDKLAGHMPDAVEEFFFCACGHMEWSETEIASSKSSASKIRSHESCELNMDVSLYPLRSDGSTEERRSENRGQDALSIHASIAALCQSQSDIQRQHRAALQELDSLACECRHDRDRLQTEIIDQGRAVGQRLDSLQLAGQHTLDRVSALATEVADFHEEMGGELAQIHQKIDRIIQDVQRDRIELQKGMSRLCEAWKKFVDGDQRIEQLKHGSLKLFHKSLVAELENNVLAAKIIATGKVPSSTSPLHGIISALLAVHATAKSVYDLVKEICLAAQGGKKQQEESIVARLFGVSRESALLIAEIAAVVTQRYAEQICRLDQRGAATLALCAAKRLLRALKTDIDVRLASGVRRLRKTIGLSEAEKGLKPQIGTLFLNTYISALAHCLTDELGQPTKFYMIPESSLFVQKSRAVDTCCEVHPSWTEQGVFTNSGVVVPGDSGIEYFTMDASSPFGPCQPDVYGYRTCPYLPNDARLWFDMVSLTKRASHAVPLGPPHCGHTEEAASVVASLRMVSTAPSTVDEEVDEEESQEDHRDGLEWV